MAYLGKVDMNDANILRYTLTSSTASTVLFSALGWTPANIQSLRVTINGVVQQNISLTSTALDLGGALVATDELEVIGIESMGNIITPADNSVSTAKLTDDSVTLAKMAGGTDGNLITYDTSGDPAYVATGTATHVLTSNGAGAAPTFQAAPAGGLTAASQWRLTTDFTGSADPIASNLEEVDAPVGFGVLGSSMTESSGIFTFPSTGYWVVMFNASFLHRNQSTGRLNIYTTTDDSTYVEATENYSHGYFCEDSAASSYIFDVADTSQCKVKFRIVVTDTAVTTKGDTNKNETYMTFLRLADT